MPCRVSLSMLRRASLSAAVDSHVSWVEPRQRIAKAFTGEPTPPGRLRGLAERITSSARRGRTPQRVRRGAEGAPERCDEFFGASCRGLPSYRCERVRAEQREVGVPEPFEETSGLFVLNHMTVRDLLIRVPIHALHRRPFRRRETRRAERHCR